MFRWLARRCFVACGGCGWVYGLFPPITKAERPLCLCGSGRIVAAERCTLPGLVGLLLFAPLIVVGWLEEQGGELVRRGRRP